MLGHVGGGTAVFTAQRQALQHAQNNEYHGCGHADRGIGRQDADDERRQAHDQDGDQEGVLASDHVAEPAEHQGAERPHDEARGKRQQGKNEGRAFIQTAEELLGNDGRERTIEVEVIPLENRAEG
ncbi:hypothetical protein D3C78_1439710 [compost metagenome]